MNAENAKLNKEWATHVKKRVKRHTSKIRRQKSREITIGALAQMVER